MYMQTCQGNCPRWAGSPSMILVPSVGKPDATAAKVATRNTGKFMIVRGLLGDGLFYRKKRVKFMGNVLHAMCIMRHEAEKN